MLTCMTSINERTAVRKANDMASHGSGMVSTRSLAAAVEEEVVEVLRGLHLARTHRLGKLEAKTKTRWQAQCS